jgi:hypothetical protein
VKVRFNVAASQVLNQRMMALIGAREKARRRTQGQGRKLFIVEPGGLCLNAPR